MATETQSKMQGYSFLISETDAQSVFTPEDFTDEHRQFAESADQFVDQEIMPDVQALERLDRELLTRKVKQAGEVGLFMIEIPEAYGGLGLDLISQLVVTERLGRSGGFSVAYGVQTGIGSEPILFFGTPEQKEKYLPRLATGELIGAYGLTEPGSGSDALAARSTATLSEDGQHYVLNGSKCFISNGGIADLYTIFAKVDGDKFTGFLIEKDTPGFSVGAEEQKMGIKSSSTTTLTLENVNVPVDNIVGEIGKGHKIALNILNLGRLKLGIGAIGAMKDALQEALAFGAQRKQFQTRLVDFPLLQQKIAGMVTATYASESMSYRTAGSINEGIKEAAADASTMFAKHLAALEEFSGECAMNKVYDSECLDRVVDEALQMHGGYGFIEEYSVARGYRDARISRIYEGTNEINRLYITGNLLKRAMSGRLPLVRDAQKIAEVVRGAPGPPARNGSPLPDVAQAVANTKKLFLFLCGAVAEKLMPDSESINKQQEALAWMADMVTEIFALESSFLRAVKRIHAGDDTASLHEDVARYQMADSTSNLERSGRELIDGYFADDSRTTILETFRRLTDWPHVNKVEIGRRLARAAVAAEKYPFEVLG